MMWGIQLFASSGCSSVAVVNVLLFNAADMAICYYRCGYSHKSLACIPLS